MNDLLIVSEVGDIQDYSNLLKALRSLDKLKEKKGSFAFITKAGGYDLLGSLMLCAWNLPRIFPKGSSVFKGGRYLLQHDKIGNKDTSLFSTRTAVSDFIKSSINKFYDKRFNIVSSYDLYNLHFWDEGGTGAQGLKEILLGISKDMDPPYENFVMLDFCEVKDTGGDIISLDIGNSSALMRAGLRMIASQIGIPLERVCVIGKSKYSIPMMGLASFTVSLDNSSKKVKEESMIEVPESGCLGIAQAVNYWVDL